MTEKGRKYNSAGKYRNTVVQGSTEQGILVKQDALVDAWNAQQEIMSFTSEASAGGAASEAVTLTGLLDTDTVIAVTQKTAGAGTGKNLIGWSTIANDALTVTWNNDPGAGAVVVAVVLRDKTELAKVALV